MKKIMVAALASILAALAATPTLAKVKSAPPPPPPAPASNWAGCYVGVNGGVGWNTGNTHYNDPNTATDPINFIPNVVPSSFMP
jgi:outer membrane immunogenic protein